MATKGLSFLLLTSWSIFCWHDRSKEVDFLIDRGGRFELYDARWTERPDMGDIANLVHVEKQLGAKNVVKQQIVSRTPNAYPISKSSKAVPVHEI